MLLGPVALVPPLPWQALLLLQVTPGCVTARLLGTQPSILLPWTDAHTVFIHLHGCSYGTASDTLHCSGPQQKTDGTQIRIIQRVLIKRLFTKGEARCGEATEASRVLGG